jgi:integrase
MWLLAVLEESQFRSRRSPTTIHNYEIALNRWAACGVTRVGDVSVASAQHFVETRLQRVQVVSVATDYHALLAVLSHLERTGRLLNAVLVALRRCAPRAPKRRQFSAPYLTAEQVDRFCGLADEETRFLVRLACYTGLRASELARLEWADIDLGAKMLHVRKGKTGPRRVPLCAPAVDILSARLARGRVFGGVGARTLQERIRESRGSGVRVTLTLCRHTRASWWVQAGVPLAKVAKWLGHSVAVCAHHYAGLADDYDPAAEQGAAG